MRNFVLISLCALFSGIIISQKVSFAHQKEVFEQIENQALFVPKAQVLEQVSFGFENLVTDLVWLHTVQYIGGNARSSDYPLLYAYLDNLTDLDPQFYLPYFVAQVLLPEIEQNEHAILISEKGIRALPENWKIPAYLGYIYYYYLEDFEKGAEFYQRASEIPGALPSAKRMAINLTSKANKHLLALEMWLELYAEEKNEEIKAMIAKKIVREQNFVELEKAVQKYFSLQNVLPENLEILVTFGLMQEIPLDPIENHKKYQLQNGVIILE